MVNEINEMNYGLNEMKEMNHGQKEVTWNTIIEADNVTTEQAGWLYYDVI